MLNDLSNTCSVLFDLLPTPVVLFENKKAGVCTFSYINQAAARCLQIDPEHILGRTPEQVFSGASGIAFQEKLTQAREQKTPQEFKLSLHREHYSKQLNIELCPTQIGDQQVSLIMATISDISGHQAALAESSKMSHLVNEIESYMAHSAHELQTPILDLSTLSKELKANFQDLGDGKLQLLDKVEGLCNNTLELINQVLQRSRAINAAVDMPNRYEFKALCSEVFYLYDPLGRHELVVDNAWINADARTMQLAMATLFENAITHNPTLSLTLSASINQSRESNMLFITLHDNGKGFDNPENAFSSKTTNGAAPGLCLMQLKQTIKDAGGGILATRPEENEGAVISFSLPGSLV